MTKQLQILLYLLAGLPCLGHGQTCDLAEEEYPIFLNGQTIIPFEMTNVLNNDLADPGQGVCAVDISLLVGPPIIEFQIWLESPDGTRVELIGPLVPSFFPGGPTRLNIRFVPNGAPTDPDTGYPDRWNNLRPDGYFPLVTPGYQGIYYPVGNLADFDSGPVNGTWRLIIENSTFFELIPNTLFDLRITLCDEAGRDCCFADSGELLQDDLSACEGAEELHLDLPPSYNLSVIQPDTAVYGYTYAVSEGGMLIGYDSIPDLRDLPAGTYQICGLSFQKSEKDNLPAPDGILTIDELRTNLSGADPLLCGSMSENCVEVVVLPNATPVILQDTICQGDSLFIGMDTLTVAGPHTIILESSNGCDSIIELELTVLPIPVVDSLATLCAGDSIRIGNSIYKTTGQYADTLQTINGCDSIINLDLTVLPPLVASLTDTICAGESYALGDSLFSSSGSYQVVLTSTHGCDSTVNLELRVLDIATQIAAPDTITCAAPEVLLSTQTTGSDMPAYAWFDVNGNTLGTDFTQSVSQGGLFYLEASLMQCTVRDTVEVFANQTPPVADAGPPDTLNCSDKTQLLIGSPASSQGPDFTYQWSTTNGHFVDVTDQLQVTVDSGGLYQLIVTDTRNGCADTAAVEIFAGNIPPVAEAGPNQLITCSEPTITLDGSASDQRPGLDYTWTALTGDLQPTGDPLRPEAFAEGIYELTVLDPWSGCSSSDRVAVFADTIAPKIDILSPEIITCSRPEIRLSAQLTDGGASPTLTWTGPGANSIVAGANTLTPLVKEAGAYELQATNPDNGCTAIAQVRVEADLAPPAIAIAPPDTIRCAGQTVTLEYLTNLDTAGLDIRWTSPAGTQLGDRIAQEVTEPGVYQLDVTDRSNGCPATGSVTVVADTTPPAVAFGDLLKACDLDTFAITAAIDRDPAIFTVQWSGPAILAGETELSPLVGEPGDYTLTLTDLDNGCTFTYSATVTEPPCGPCLEADPAPAFSCNEDDLQIEVRFCDDCAGCTIEWTTTGGQILSGANTLTPVVGQAGTYTVTVTDTFNLTAQLDIVVAEERDYPTAIAGPDTTLNCRVSTLLLGSEETETGAGIQIRWRSLTTGSTSLGSAPFLEVERPDIYILEVRNQNSGCISRDSVGVALDDTPPLANAGADTSLTCITTTLVLDGSASATGSNIRYQWTASNGGQIDQGADTPNPQISAPGSYILQVFNEVNGCSASDQVVVGIEDTPPAISLPEPPALSCLDTIVLLMPNGIDTTAYRYQWCALDVDGAEFDCQDAPLYNARVAGDYQLRVTDRTTGCENTAIATVPANLTPPLVDAGPDTVVNCFNDQLQLSGSADGAASLRWQTVDGQILSGENTATPLIAGPGLYILTAADPATGCSASDTLVVAADLATPEARLTQDAGSLVLTCDVDTLTLDASTSIAAGSNGLNFLWSTEETTGGLSGSTDAATIQITAGGSYQLEVQDRANGCRDTLTFQVGIDFIRPGVSILPVESITCNRTSVTIDARNSETGSGIRHRWFRDGEPLADTSLLLTVSQGGTYRLESAYRDNGCVSEAAVEVEADNLPPEVRIADPQILDCDNPAATLDASATTGEALSFRWSTNDGNILSGAETAVITVNAPGTYSLRVINANNGCVGRGSIDVNFSGLRLGPLNLSITPPSCPGEADGAIRVLSVNGGTDPFVYALNDANFTTSDHFTGLAPGTYQLKVMDAAGCEADTTVILPEPEGVLVSLGADRTVRQGEEVRLEALTNVKDPARIAWSPAELVERQDTLIQTLQPRRSATYRVEITDENGCTGSDEVQIAVTNELPVYIANAFSPNEDGENDRFFIQASDAVNLIKSFRIFDRWGNTVFEATDIPPNDPQLGWDGYYRGQLMNNAVFVYFAEVELTGGEVEMVQGEVALVR